LFETSYSLVQTVVSRTSSAEESVIVRAAYKAVFVSTGKVSLPVTPRILGVARERQISRKASQGSQI
jgi:hypothetical protein